MEEGVAVTSRARFPQRFVDTALAIAVDMLFISSTNLNGTCRSAATTVLLRYCWESTTDRALVVMLHYLVFHVTQEQMEEY